VIVQRITDYVEVPSMIPVKRDLGPTTLTLSRDQPGVQDHGKRNPAGYVTLDLPSEGVFAISQLRRALDEFERVVRDD